ncbi:MAG TPA: efflux RND transporter periplasmic adaptor subunit [Terriglobia bacterium]|nr:efflux RND transporter periplasmic adaptor subunit [Terriglobia bacterium]
MKRLIPVLLLLGIGGAVVYFHPEWFRKPPPVTALKLSGNIEAHESLVSFKVSGRIIALPIKEGMTLKSGDLVARLDRDDYQQQVVVDEAASHVWQKQLTLGLAGSRAQDIEAAKQVALEALADLEQKKSDYARYQALFEKDEIPAQTRDQAATNVTRAQAVYAQAEQNLQKLEEGTRPEELAVQRANVKYSDQNLRMARIRLSYTTLTAPFDGVILVRQAELGEVVVPGTPIITLADLDHLWVRVYVPETDLGKVHWDQAVDVRTDTYPDKVYRGRISFISSEAEFTPKSVQTEKERVTLVYRVKVEVENPNHELKPGMPADAYISLK